MKKKILVLIALITAISAGCTGGQTQGGGSEGSGADITIAIVLPMEHPSLAEIRDSIALKLAPIQEIGRINVVHKNANGEFSALPSIMQGLVADGTDIIIAIATPTAQAAKAAIEGTDVKLVFSAVSNPVPLIVDSLTDTSANITGVSDFIPVDEIFALAGILTPEAKTFGFVYNPSETNSVTNIQRAKDYCDAAGIAYKEAAALSTAEVATAAQSLVGQVDAFFTPDDNTAASAMAPYAQVAIENSIPLYVGADSMVIDGGLAAVGINYTRLGEITAAMALNLVDGQSTAQNPVIVVQDYSRIINESTAEALSIEIPADKLGSYILY
ncbi:MAG: ABC transporter substrate-binding protein [Eubacteriaceae bacterium]|nr:ABC transporter substrate-binding protein [Eubacteriaceae bacterium]